MLDLIKHRIEEQLDTTLVQANGESGHFDVLVVGDCFDGKSPVQRQKMVYATVNDIIQSGEIHAITIKAYTPAQWETQRHLQVGGA